MVAVIGAAYYGVINDGSVRNNDDTTITNLANLKFTTKGSFLK
jgi:hypothetical protein